MLAKTKVSCMVKTHIFYFIPLPFLRVFKEIRSQPQLKKCAKGGGLIKDKMCVFTIRETFFIQAYAKNVRVPSKPLPLHLTLETTYPFYYFCFGKPISLIF